MSKTKKIENWLDTLIFAQKLYNSCGTLSISSKQEVNVCGVNDYIQLYNCIDYIAKMLDLEITIKDNANHEKSIIYKGMKFIEI